MTQNPALTVLRAEREKHAQKLDLLMSEVKAVRASLKSFDDAIAVLEGGITAAVGTPMPQERQSGSRLPLKAIILEILQGKPGLGTQEIKSELLARGRDTDANTILGTLSRMRRDDASIHKHGGVWFAGTGESNADDVNEKEKTPDHSGASHEIGDSVVRTVGYPPVSSEGANPSISTSVRNDLLSSTSGRSANPASYPWKR